MRLTKRESWLLAHAHAEKYDMAHRRRARVEPKLPAGVELVKPPIGALDVIKARNAARLGGEEPSALTVSAALYLELCAFYGTVAVPTLYGLKVKVDEALAAGEWRISEP